MPGKWKIDSYRVLDVKIAPPRSSVTPACLCNGCNARLARGGGKFVPLATPRPNGLAHEVLCDTCQHSRSILGQNIHRE
jgi:hypothetical protein